MVFIYMGLNKALDPVAFLKLVRQYDLMPYATVLNLIAVVVPWFEVFCGLLLLAGIAVRGSALVLAMMLVAFTGIVLRRAILLHSQMAPGIDFCAIAFDCGCGTGPVLICRKLAENVFLCMLASALLFLPRIKEVQPINSPQSAPP